MERRTLLSLAGLFLLDPDRALWVRGAKMISIPAVPVRLENVADLRTALNVGDMVSFPGMRGRWRVTKMFAKGYCIAHLEPCERDVTIAMHGRAYRTPC